MHVVICEIQPWWLQTINLNLIEYLRIGVLVMLQIVKLLQGLQFFSYFCIYLFLWQLSSNYDFPITKRIKLNTWDDAWTPFELFNAKPLRM